MTHDAALESTAEAAVWPVEVATSNGRVQGEAVGALNVWRSIPYGRAASGIRRFRSPEAPLSWDGVRDCRDWGEISPQGFTHNVPISRDLIVGEDCLWLSIWAPRTVDEPRPVMVWIHGGAFAIGTAAQEIYDGAHLAELGNIVLVSINYRIGALGFVDLSAFSSPQCLFETNVGLRDQLFALEWIRENIANFGGDPEQITLFGESSGAGCVTTLLTSPKAKGLFHRAIAQSPPATVAYGPERAHSVALRFLEVAGIAPADASQLTNLPLAQLIAASEALIGEVPTTAPGTLATAPVVDGDIVPRYPVAAFQKGESHPVPLIIGTNKDEAALFKKLGANLLPVEPDAVNAMLEAIAAENPDVSAERIAEIAAAYPDVSTSRGAMAIAQDAAFRMPSVWIAEAHSRHAPTWLYRFDYATPMLRAAGIGASHATELPYVFGNFGSISPDPTFWLGGRKVSLEVAGRIQRRWLAFAEFGVPAALDGSKHWARYSEDSRQTLLIDATDALVDDPDIQMREAWGTQVTGFS